MHRVDLGVFTKGEIHAIAAGVFVLEGLDQRERNHGRLRGAAVLAARKERVVVHTDEDFALSKHSICVLANRDPVRVFAFVVRNEPFDCFAALSGSEILGNVISRPHRGGSKSLEFLESLRQLRSFGGGRIRQDRQACIEQSFDGMALWHEIEERLIHGVLLMKSGGHRPLGGRFPPGVEKSDRLA